MAGEGLWHNATRASLQCNDAEFFRVRGLIGAALASLEGAAANSTGALLARLDVLNFQDAWAGCDAAARGLLQRAEVTIELQNSTLCTPELAAGDDPCCSLQGLWEGCCAPRAVNLTVLAYPDVLQQKVGGGACMCAC